MSLTGVVPGRGQGTSQIRDKEGAAGRSQAGSDGPGRVPGGHANAWKDETVSLQTERGNLDDTLASERGRGWQASQANHFLTSKCGAGSENRGRMRDNSQVSHWSRANCVSTLRRDWMECCNCAALHVSVMATRQLSAGLRKVGAWVDSSRQTTRTGPDRPGTPRQQFLVIWD